MSAPGDDLRFALLRLRLVVGGMIFGLIAFSLITSFLLDRQGPAMSSVGQPLVGVLLVLIFSETTAWALLRRSFVERQRRLLRARPELSPELALVAPFVTLRTIAAALTEAPALLGIVVYFLTGHAALLAVPAVAVFVLLRVQADEADYQRFVREVTA